MGEFYLDAILSSREKAEELQRTYRNEYGVKSIIKEEDGDFELWAEKKLLKEFAKYFWEELDEELNEMEEELKRTK